MLKNYSGAIFFTMLEINKLQIILMIVILWFAISTIHGRMHEDD